MEIEVNLPDFQLLRAAIRRRQNKLADAHTPLSRIRADFYSMEREWFESEGGAQWEALSPRYAAWKNRKYPGKTILRRQDRLYDAVTGNPEDSALSLDELRIFIHGVPYWKAHDKGIGRLPVRKVISEQITVRKVEWAQWVTDWFTS